MMKRYLEIVIIIFSIFLFPFEALGEDTLPGYSDWTTEEKDDENRVEAIQYGRQLASSWSSWDRNEPTGKTDVKYMEMDVKHLAVDFDEGVYQEWRDADAKTIYTWKFTKSFKMVSVHADVDTFYFYTDRDGDHYRRFSAPPLEVYCDGELVASTGKHDRLKNWDAELNTTCSYVELKMLDDTGNGRNGTSASNIYLIKSTPSWAYVTGWSEGTDWRFDEEYERIYGGENPQIPVSRKVYSYPLTYQINYDLDGGEFLEEITSSYTIFDEVIIPAAYKKGYDFLGFYDENGNKVIKIEKGSYGTLNLKAKYERKMPSIYVGYTYFFKEDRKIDNEELLKLVNAKAIDEVEGDISSNIGIESITYEDKNVTTYNPSYLDVSEEGSILIKFFVRNSDGIVASIERKYRIFGMGENIENYSDNIKIYTRYISEEYVETLDSNSVWKEADYQEILNKAFAKIRKE